MRQIDTYAYMSDTEIAWHTIAYHELTDEPFDDDDKLVIADALCDAVSPYDAAFEVDRNIVNDVYDDMLESLRTGGDADLCQQWLYAIGYDTIWDYINTDGLPFPDAYDMAETVLDGVDMIDYINGCDDYIDVYHEHVIYNMADDGIVTAFDAFCSDLITESD